MVRKIDPAGYVARCREIIERHTIRELSALGEECVKRIRDRSPEDSWIDHTGNLRSSIGYMVLCDGKEVSANGFLPTESPEGNGSKGQQEGRRYMEEIARDVAGSSGFSLVIVAGMNYADKVEALDNKDVLASTKIWAANRWPGIERKLKAKIEKEINKLEIF